MITDKIYDEIVGIDKENKVYQGYDSSCTMPDHYWYTYEECENKLTKQDCLELADVMIKRWQDFKEHWSNYDDAGN